LPEQRRVVSRRRPARAITRGPVAALVMAVTALGIASCGDQEPFADAPPQTTPSFTVLDTSPGGSGTPDSAAAPGAESTPEVDSPAATQPGSPAEEPSPAGVTPDDVTKKRERPHSLSERVAADETAKLNVRTMVSIIEGCHSGRDTYKACNSHGELGSPKVLGLTIGKRRGDVQINASDNGFRITGISMSGAKFTMARGPKGDRFKCIAGRMPGACPPDRAWSF
jgi:hypothetical protein